MILFCYFKRFFGDLFKYGEILRKFRFFSTFYLLEKTKQLLTQLEGTGVITYNDIYSILINSCVKTSFQVGGYIQTFFFSPLMYLESETVCVLSI